MPFKKSELYSSLWKSRDGLRSGMGASQCNGYVLVRHVAAEPAVRDAYVEAHLARMGFAP